MNPFADPSARRETASADAALDDGSSRRSRFIRKVAEAFEEAAVDHVFLHGYDPDARDSDIDVAVARESRIAVDLILRSGRLGPLVQRLDHDVPWCHYYVVAVNEPTRRYRQLDVTCDPWGISKDGSAIRVAMCHRRRVNGLSVPTPAAEAVYLILKRARKGVGPGELARLHNAFLADPQGATAILQQEFGEVGLRAGMAIQQGSDLENALLDLSLALRRMNASGTSFARRTQHEARRIIRRISRPTGMSVGLAGPDGTGKSSLATSLGRESVGLYRAVKPLHLGPGLLPPPARLLGRVSAPATEPHGRQPSGRAGSALRTTYLVLDTALGWPTEVWLPRVRSSLVTLERGMYDLIVDPQRYRLRRPPRLVERLLPILPNPDLTLVLDAPAAVIHERKRELPVAEIERQLQMWRTRAAQRGGFQVLDASRSERTLLAQSLDAIDDVLAARQGRYDLASLALECLGGISTRGARYRILSVGNQPRWLLPAGLGPLSSGLYRSASRRHHAGALALENWKRFGCETRIDTRRGLAPVIARSLGVREVSLAAALPREQRRTNRLFLSVLAGGRVVAFAKVNRQASGISREVDVLRALAGIPLNCLVTPEVFDTFDWNDLSVLLLEPLPIGDYANREIGPAEVAGLVEFAGLSDRLAPIIGLTPGLLPTHGDFTGWNSAVLRDGRLCLWDWEDVRTGIPLEDFFYWRLQRLLRFGKGTIADLARGAHEPDMNVLSLCNALGLDSAQAPTEALEACLGRLEVQVSSDVDLPAERITRAVLAKLSDA